MSNCMAKKMHTSLYPSSKFPQCIENLQEEWKAIPQEIRVLINSMLRQFQAAIRARGNRRY